MHHWFQQFIAHAIHYPEYEPSVFVMGCSVAAAVSGILLAGIIYLKNTAWATAVAKTFPTFYKLSFNKFYFDEIYSRLIIRPFVALGNVLFKFDATVIDGTVNGTGHATVFLSRVKQWIDTYIVDAAVNFMGTLVYFLNSITKRIQTGFVQNYLLIAFLALIAFLIFELKLA
jgi:NADH-quinone oxidoreductase subunit L